MHAIPTLVIVSATNISSFGNNSRLSNSYEVDPKWEFPRDLLELSEIILYDGFSTVLYKGTANGIKSDKAIDVAVKFCKDQASEEDVRALIADMEQLAGLSSHPNIIGLLRVCTVESESLPLSLLPPSSLPPPSLLPPSLLHPSSLPPPSLPPPSPLPPRSLPPLSPSITIINRRI